MKPCVVLLSGGLDSATVLGLARSEGRPVHALSFRYGQRHGVELECATEQARLFEVERHLVLNVDLDKIGGSALTDRSLDVPGADLDSAAIPITYVPARNTVFLAHALAVAEVVGADRIDLGINAVDYSGYPDCRPEYLAAFQRLADLATAAGVEGRSKVTLHAPLIRLSKPEIIRRGMGCGVDYGKTSSCYDPGPSGAPCRRCDSCVIRAAAFAEIGIADPRIG